MSELRKAVIKNADMTEDMQQVRPAANSVSRMRAPPQNYIFFCQLISNGFGADVDQFAYVSSLCALDRQQDAVDCATQALEKYNIEKDVAAYIKKEFDKKYNPTWYDCRRMFLCAIL